MSRATAIILPFPASASLKPLGLRKTFFSNNLIITAANAIITNFTSKIGFNIIVVAFAIARTAPDITESMKPAHMNGNNRPSG